jgi:hypothetical protein
MLDNLIFFSAITSTLLAGILYLLWDIRRRLIKRDKS